MRRRANVARIDALGVEARVEQRWDTFGVRLAANYANAEVDGGADAPQLMGLRPAQAPEFAATAGIDWYAPYRFVLHIDLRYEGDRFEDDLNSRPLNEAFTVDVRLDYQITENISVYGAVDNPFDAEIRTRLTSVYEYGPPQLWRIGLAYRR